MQACLVFAINTFYLNSQPIGDRSSGLLESIALVVTRQYHLSDLQSRNFFKKLKGHLIFVPRSFGGDRFNSNFNT